MTDKIVVKDANEMDKRIPRELIFTFQGKPYILYGGLLWKAMYLYGGGNYGIETKIITNDPENVLVEAIFKTKDGIVFNNFGTATKANVSNPQMHKYLVHLAITRSVCRVLRMATACGFASYDEMFSGNENGKPIPESPTDGEKPTEQQLETIATLSKKQGVPPPKVVDQKGAKEAIAELVSKKV